MCHFPKKIFPKPTSTVRRIEASSTHSKAPCSPPAEQPTSFLRVCPPGSALSPSRMGTLWVDSVGPASCLGPTLRRRPVDTGPSCAFATSLRLLGVSGPERRNPEPGNPSEAVALVQVGEDEVGLRGGGRRRRKVNSLATSSWTSPPGSSRQWSLDLHEWMTGKETARVRKSRVSPGSALCPRFPALWLLALWGHGVRTEAGGFTIFKLWGFGGVSCSLWAPLFITSPTRTGAKNKGANGVGVLGWRWGGVCEMPY